MLSYPSTTHPPDAICGLCYFRSLYSPANQKRCRTSIDPAAWSCGKACPKLFEFCAGISALRSEGETPLASEPICTGAVAIPTPQAQISPSRPLSRYSHHSLGHIVTIAHRPLTNLLSPQSTVMRRLQEPRPIDLILSRNTRRNGPKPHNQKGSLFTKARKNATSLAFCSLS